MNHGVLPTAALDTAVGVAVCVGGGALVGDFDSPAFGCEVRSPSDGFLREDALGGATPV